MAERNVIEHIVVPEVPNVLPGEQLYVYVPIATAKKLGIIKVGYGLNVVNGFVSINDSYINNLIDEGISDKQDKVDDNITQAGAQASSSDKSVVGNINNLYYKILLDESTISSLGIRLSSAEGNISSIGGRVTTLERQAQISKTWIGNMTVSALPTDEQLDAYVYDIVARVPRIGDTIIVTLQISGATDKNYEYFYSEADWSHYEIPVIEPSDNGTKGIVAGSYTATNISAGLLGELVSIVNGEISGIFVKTQTGYSSLKSIIDSLNSSIADIVDGTTTVGKASSADTATSATSATKDGDGNVITSTYMSISAGATKQFVKDYALPRSFNDVSYLSGSTANQFSDTVPANPGISNTSGQIIAGNTEICKAVKQYTNITFEIGPKNGYFSEYYVQYNSSVVNDSIIVSFVLVTEIYVSGTGWITAKSEETNTMTVDTGITKVTFNSNFSALVDNDGDPIIYNLTDPQIRQTLYVKSAAASLNTFTVYSSADYPSVFYLTTTSVVQYLQQGELGQVVRVSPSVNAVVNDNVVSYEIVINNPLTFADGVIVVMDISAGWTGNVDVNAYEDDTNLITLKVGGVSTRLFTATNFNDIVNKPTTKAMLKSSCFFKESKSSNSYSITALLVCYCLHDSYNQPQFYIVGMNNLLLDDIVNSSIGASGTATLDDAAWSNGSYTLTVGTLGANDAIFITPATAADRALMQAAEIFVTASTGSVTFTATTTPSSDIGIKYFISRGA